MSRNKKKKAQAESVDKTPLAPKGAYEGGGGLYDGGPQHRSLKDEMHDFYQYKQKDDADRLHGTPKSKHRRQDVEERQVIPLLFLFKWAVLGVIGFGLIIVLKMFLSNYNKNAADEIEKLRAQVTELERARIERPVLDLDDVAQIPMLVDRWEKAQKNAQAATDLMRWDRRDEALRRLHEALEVTPEYQPAIVLAAEIAMKNEQFERAANLLVRALNMDPSRHDLAVMLAQALERLEDDKAALAVADWALSTQSRDLEALAIASRTSVRLEDWPSALEYFNKALIVDANNLDALLGASAIYLQDKKYAKALPLFIRLMDLEPESWRHFFNAAVCQAQLNQPENTVRTLELAAAHFGDAQVYGWVGASQFDPVRQTVLFNGFEQRVAQIAQRKVQKKIEKEKEVFAPAGPALPTGEALKASDLK